jgi:hypothetical protein
MKKSFFLPFIIVITVLFFSFASCKKDDAPAPKTKTELLTASTWRFSGATVGGADASAFIQPCQKDNTITFITAGMAGTLDEGALKCNMADPQTRPFTWSFNSGETQLNISTTLFTGGSSAFTLVSLSETQLVVSQNITISGTTQNAVVTFVH